MMQRVGWVIELRGETLDEYKRLHREVWPGVLKMIQACHFTNYTIYHRELIPGRHFLFSHMEYTGEDLVADSAKMAADEETQRWWKVCHPCQHPIETAAPGEWWSDMEEVFHCD